MPQYNQINETRNQLATPMVTGGAGMQAINAMPNTNLLPIQQGQQQNRPNRQPGKLKTGNNPNPKFPLLRNGWEGLKDWLGNAGYEAKRIAVGTPDEVEQYSTVTPEMQQILQYLQHMGVLAYENQYEGFDPIEQQAQNGFNQDISSLAHRFTSLGSAGLDSPDFAASAGSAAGDFRTNLAAQRAQWGQQNRQQALQTLQLGLNPQVENINRPGQNGLLQELLLGLAGASPDLLKSYLKNRAKQDEKG